jgi:hypothetical protein
VPEGLDPRRALLLGTHLLLAAAALRRARRRRGLGFRVVEEKRTEDYF